MNRDYQNQLSAQERVLEVRDMDTFREGVDRLVVVISYQNGALHSPCMLSNTLRFQTTVPYSLAQLLQAPRPDTKK